MCGCSENRLPWQQKFTILLPIKQQSLFHFGYTSRLSGYGRKTQQTPKFYLDYGDLTWSGWYRDFINAVVINKIDKWVWIGLSLFALEGIILVLFKMMCPLTIIARKYSDSSKDNFDIFLPNWLAKNNKLIYTIFLSIILIILVFRLAFK